MGRICPGHRQSKENRQPVCGVCRPVIFSLCGSCAAGGCIDTRRAAAWNWVGLRAPHRRLLFWRKRVSRKQRHVRFGQIPFIAAFSGRRAQSPAVIVAGQFTLSWLLHGAPFMPPRKRAQGFDVALYRRGAGRLVGAEVGSVDDPASGWQTPTAEKANMLPTV